MTYETFRVNPKKALYLLQHGQVMAKVRAIKPESRGGDCIFVQDHWTGTDPEVAYLS